MIDISIQNFEADLIQASTKQAILLDIWAPWCGPCKALGPVLEKLETAYSGRFKLAKLNADEQPEISGQLSQMLGVRSVPFCVMFKGGQPVDGFVGALPEAQVREFLDRHVPSVEQTAADAEVEQAQDLLAEGDADSALKKLQEAVAIDPANDAARYDYLRALLSTGRVAEARAAFDQVANKPGLDSKLVSVDHWLAACEAVGSTRDAQALAAAIQADKRNFAARFELAQTHFAAQRWTAAMDELLEVMMHDKTWNDEIARKTYVAILELMTQPPKARTENSAATSTLEVSIKLTAPQSDPVVNQYRRKLSMVLF